LTIRPQVFNNLPPRERRQASRRPRVPPVERNAGTFRPAFFCSMKRWVDLICWMITPQFEDQPNHLVIPRNWVTISAACSFAYNRVFTKLVASYNTNPGWGRDGRPSRASVAARLGPRTNSQRSRPRSDNLVRQSSPILPIQDAFESAPALLPVSCSPEKAASPPRPLPARLLPGRGRLQRKAVCH